MLGRACLRILLLAGLLTGSWAQAFELNPVQYDIYVGNIDANGDPDFYFHGKPLTLLLHGDIVTPIVLPAPPSFVIYQNKLETQSTHGGGSINYNNSHGYYHPEPYSLTPNQIAAMGLTLYQEGIDFFAGDFNGNGQRDLLLRGATASHPALILESSFGSGLPQVGHQYRNAHQLPHNLSDRAVKLRVEDVNGNGRADLVVVASSAQYAEVAYLSDSAGIPQEYTITNTAPSVTTPSLAGSSAGQFRVDESGAATYSMPLSLPGGSGGVTPELSLNYSSQGGNGLLGLGWNLGGLSAISRCRQTLSEDGVAKPITWSAQDRFCLDGQRLVLHEGSSYGAVGATYKTAIDSFVTVTSHGGTLGNPHSFTVERKDGSTSYYGGNGGSSQVLPGGTAPTTSWLLNRFEDSVTVRTGVRNTIDYQYEGDHNSGQRLATIRYAYGESDNSAVYVHFDYEDRPDISRGYQGGHLFTLNQRLRRIRVTDNQFGGTQPEVRRYELRYQLVANDGLHRNTSKLASVQECVLSACLPATQFEWTHQALGFDTAISGSIPLPSSHQDSYLKSYHPADLNGNGNLDLVYLQLDPQSNGDYRHSVRYTLSDGAGVASTHTLTSYTGDGNAHTAIAVLDYNGDGRQDIAFYNPSVGSWRIYLSAPDANGNWTVRATDFVTTPIDKVNVSFVDFTSNGLVDAVSVNRYWTLQRNNQPASSNKAYSFSNSNSFTWLGMPAPQYNTLPSWTCNPIYTNDDERQIIRAQPGDFNGNGSIDFVGFRTKRASCDQSVTTNTVYYALTSDNGTLRRYATLPISGGGATAQISVVDINGDGLSDIFYKQGGTYYYLLNNGNGFNSPVPFGSGGGAKPAFIDYNGNGATDVYWHDTSTGELKVRLWTGTTFGPARVIRHGVGQNSNHSHIFMDMNGDGQPDYIRITHNQLQTYLGRTLPAGQAPDAIVAIDNGLGNITDIHYGTLGRSGHYTRMDVNPTVTTHTGTSFPGACPPNVGYGLCGGSYTYQTVSTQDFYQRLNGGWPDLPAGSKTLIADNSRKDHPTLEVTGSVYVVTSVASTAPRAGTTPGNVVRNAKSRVSYYYGEAKLQASGRGFLGFHKLKTVDEQSGIATTTYRQDYPFIGVPLSTQVYSADGESGALLSRSDNVWDFKVVGSGASQRYQPYLKQSIERTYALKNNGAAQGDPLKTVTTEQVYDDFGNPTRITVTTEGEDNSYRRQVTDNNYGVGWMREMGRLMTATVTTTDNAGNSDVRNSSFEYYPQTHVHKGLLRWEIAYPNSLALRTTTGYEYDTFGNQTKVTLTATGVPSRTSEAIYDERGRYMVSRKNALGQVEEEITARHVTGAPETVLDIHGNATNFTYDVLGREAGRSDASGAWVSSQYSLCSWGCPAGAVYYIEKQQAGASGSSQEYFDVLGRSIQKRHRNFNGRWVYTVTEYDSHSRPKYQSNPYFSDASPTGWTEYRYDLLGRDTQIVQPDGVVASTTVYNGFETRITTARGQIKIKTHNALGELTRVVDNGGGMTAAWVDYQYDLRGNLLEAITSAPYVASVRVRMCYDRMGRKFAMHDPDKGGFVGNANATCDAVGQSGNLDGWWYYHYNGFGELLSQKDTKKQTRNMQYDLLGRMTRRTDRRADGTVESHTRWYYDNQVSDIDTTGRLGNLARVVQSTSTGDESCSNNNYCTTYFYDDLGRTTDTTVFHPGDSSGYSTRIEYDAIGRPTRQYDVLSGLVVPDSGIEQHYNIWGYKSHVTDIASGDILHRIVNTDVWGNVIEELRANGAHSYYEYDPVMGHLKQQRSLIAGVLPLQDIRYDWDVVGNLTYRHNQSVSANNNNQQKDLRESFCYDGLNRLIKTHLGTLQGSCSSGNPDIQYNGLGDITFKADVGTYTYNRTVDNGIAGPHAVTSAGGISYSYDHNGNMVSGNLRTLVYNTFDKPIEITRNGNKVEFSYGPDRSRYQRVDTKSSEVTTTLYLGNVERIHKHGSNEITWRRTVAGAIYTVTTDLNHQVQGDTDKAFVYTDHLGSTDVITDKQANVVQSMSFDAWGQRRDSENWSAMNPLGITYFNTSRTKRGYTGHEQLDEYGLIHMNGRVYDPKLARFLQADPFIQAAANTQSYNRYSYVINNPLNATDPSGYLFKKIRRGLIRAAVKVFGRDLVNIVGTAVSTFVGFVVGGPPGSAAGSAAWTYEFNRAMGVSSREAFGSAIIAGWSAVAFGAIGQSGWHPGTQALAHGTVGGITSVMQGGKFGHGFASAGFTKLAMGPLGFDFDYENTEWSAIAGRTTVAAIVGGTVSEMTGGKFANGARTAAMAHLVNAESRGIAGNLQGAQENQCLSVQVCSVLENIYKDDPDLPQGVNVEFADLSGPGRTASKNKILLDNRFRGTLSEVELFDLQLTIYHELLHVDAWRSLGTVRYRVGEAYNFYKGGFDAMTPMHREIYTAEWSYAAYLRGNADMPSVKDRSWRK